MPLCEMSEHVVFVVLNGEVTVEVNAEKANLREKHCLITGPATLSMQTKKSVRMLGVQISTADEIRKKSNNI